MRRRLAAAVLAVCVLAPAAAAQARVDLLTARDRESFGRLERSLGGALGLAVAPLGSEGAVERVGSLKGGVAWSTSKVPVAMAVVARGGQAAHAADLRAAITASDNAAAERLFASLGSPAAAAKAATRQVRAAGDRHTVVESRRLRSGFTAFGQTAWTVAGQARFAAGLPCLAAGRTVLGLMGRTIAAQRWGLARIDSKALLKGGWGPGSSPGAAGGDLDRQLGIARIHGRRVAIAMIARPGDGDHGTGTRQITEIARWAADHVDTDGVSSSVTC